VDHPGRSRGGTSPGEAGDARGGGGSMALLLVVAGRMVASRGTPGPHTRPQLRSGCRGFHLPLAMVIHVISQISVSLRSKIERRCGAPRRHPRRLAEGAAVRAAGSSRRLFFLYPLPSAVLFLSPPSNHLTSQAVSCMNILHDFHENNSLDRLIIAAYILYQAVG
jgi:hypothetical protein